MQVKSLAVEESAFLHLRDANDELLCEGGDPQKAVGITFYGPGTKVYAKATQVKSNRLVDRLKKKGKTDMTPEETAEENAVFLAACTKEFHYLEADGLQGEALFKAVYKDAQVGFIAEQGSKFLNDWANFSKPSATS